MLGGDGGQPQHVVAPQGRHLDPVAPGFITGRIRRSTASDTAGDGRQVMTWSTAAARSSALVGQHRPHRNQAFGQRRFRSCTVTFKARLQQAAAHMPAQIAQPDISVMHDQKSS
jgi:hypothetical protein